MRSTCLLLLLFCMLLEFSSMYFQVSPWNKETTFGEKLVRGLWKQPTPNLVKNIFCLIMNFIFVLNSSIEVLCHYCWSKNEVCVLILMGKITTWHYPFTLDLWWNYLDIFTEINIIWNWWMFQHMSSWLHLWAYE